MNNIVKGKQFTILWNANDIKMPHVDSEVISRILSDIDTEYVNIAKITITRGKIHKYLGMTINYSSTSKVNLSMADHIGNILDDIPEYIKG